MLTKEKVGTALKRTARILPGIGSYQDKEAIRESDKALRTHISEGLKGLMDTLERLKTDLVRSGTIGPLKEIDDLVRSLEKISRTILYASRGYSGLFDDRTVSSEILNKVYEYDKNLLTTLSTIGDRIGKSAKRRSGISRSAIEGIRADLFALEEKVAYRESLLRGSPSKRRSLP